MKMGLLSHVDPLEMLVGMPVDAVPVNPGFGLLEDWKGIAMQIAQTSRSEMAWRLLRRGAAHPQLRPGSRSQAVAKLNDMSAGR
jgi:hypothetical protein